MDFKRFWTELSGWCWKNWKKRGQCRCWCQNPGLLREPRQEGTDPRLEEIKSRCVNVKQGGQRRLLFLVLLCSESKMTQTSRLDS